MTQVAANADAVVDAGIASRRPSLRTQPFAWDGLAFDVPAGWELAIHQRRRKLTHVEFDDRYGRRMEVEWTRPRHRVDVEAVHRRYDRASAKLTRQAKKTRAIDGLPEGWIATWYDMLTDEGLLSAFYLPADGGLFVFMLIHFDEEQVAAEDPDATIAAIAESFDTHAGDILPWRMYDVHAELPKQFKLLDSRVETGLKTLEFGWTGRRLHLWFVSLADRVTRETTLEEWAPEFLNARIMYKGVTFRQAVNGGIECRKAARHVFGRGDEIARLCFRYRASAKLLKSRNQIAVQLLHYRREVDLDTADLIRFPD